MQTKPVEYIKNGITFVVTDYSVNRSQNEDKLYEDYDFWLSLPRGKATVHVGNELVYTLSGLRKYGTEEECYGRKENVTPIFTKAYATVKENGECFHLGMFKYKDVVYALVGSKNVHLLVDTSQPIDPQLEAELQRQKTRVSYACEMAQTYFELYHTLNVSDELVPSKFTLVGESINPSHEHVVQYNQRCMRFYALTSQSPDQPYVALGYSQCLEKLRRMGLPVVDVYECTPTELKHTKQSFFDKENCEGMVVYYTDEQDNVIMMHKFKAKQYTILRTIRELFKGGHPLSKLQDRLQTYHLKLASEEIEEWCKFYKWLQLIQPSECFSVKLWDEFVATKPNLDAHTECKVVVLSGLPGAGKTSVGGTVAYLLNCESIHAEYIDQDMFNGNKKMFLNHLAGLLHPRKRCKYVFVGRCNATVASRQECLQLSSNNLLVHLESPDVNELVQRVNERKFHSTLKPGPKVLNVIKMFQAKFEPIQPDEAKSVLSLDHNLLFDEKVQMVFKALELSEPVSIPYFQWCKFIGLKVELQDLKDLIDSDTHVKDYKVKCIDPHVTLLHHTDFHRYPQVAYNLQELISEGKVDYSIEVYYFKYSDRISAFFVGLDHKLQHKCPSSHQHHITYNKEAKVDSTESNSLYNDSKAGTRYFNFRVRLQCKLQLW